MTPENDKLLCEKYPKIFAQRHLPMDRTCMCWGLDTLNGWAKLIDELCGRLQAIADTVGIQVVATQVKEKYAGLRFYYVADGEGSKLPEEEARVWHDIIDDLVEKACSESEQTCEECGKHGEVVVRHGWWMTRCKEHSKEPECLHRYTKWLAMNEINRLKEEEEEKRAEEEATQKAIAASQKVIARAAKAKEPRADKFCKGVLKAHKQYRAGKVVPMDDVLKGPPGKKRAKKRKGK